MRDDILAYANNEGAFHITMDSRPPYRNMLQNIHYVTEIKSYLPQESLALKTYQSDMFNNWLKTETIIGANSIAEISAIDVSAGLLKMDALNLAQKVYNMLNRIAVSGGSYYDWIEAVYTEKALYQNVTPSGNSGIKTIVANADKVNVRSGNGTNFPVVEMLFSL